MRPTNSVRLHASRSATKAGFERPEHPGRMLLAAAGLLIGSLSAIVPAWAAEDPLVLDATFNVPGVPLGPYSDHLTVDLVGKRVFATPQAAKMVAVLDLHDGHVLKMIPVGNPHGIYYSASMKRLFVADGAAGDIDVFNGDDYSLIKKIHVGKDTDWFTFDPNLQRLYVNNGGEAAGTDSSLVTIIDAVKLEKVGDISIPAPSPEGSALDADKQLLYVNLNIAGAVAVVDLRKRETIAVWKLPPGGHRAMGAALDTARERLYVTTRDTSIRGSVIVLDTTSGRTVATLPIGGWADDVSIDPKRQRIYVVTGVGYVDTYAIGANDVYQREPRVETALLAKTGIYSKELDRMFVSVPTMGDFGVFQVLVFKPVP